MRTSPTARGSFSVSIPDPELFLHFYLNFMIQTSYESSYGQIVQKYQNFNMLIIVYIIIIYFQPAS